MKTNPVSLLNSSAFYLSMNRSVTPGILDLSLLHYGISAGEAVRETAALAVHADMLGYKRFWVTEHHNNPALGCASPEVLMAHLASLTKNCKIGSGGILLSNYSPLHIAENFRMLEALFPGRIEMGIGRSSGGDSIATAALNATGNAGFENKFLELTGYFNDTNPVNATPVTASSPLRFLLGSSVTSANDAARLQLPYVYAQFLNPAHNKNAAAAYANGPSFEGKSMGVAVFFICADDPETLQLRKAYAEFYLKNFYSGNFQNILSNAFTYDSSAISNTPNPSLLAGTPGELEKEIEKLCDDCQADHILFIPAAEKLQERKEMLELLIRLPVFKRAQEPQRAQ
jgi:luciferase family oxidoreductase group 1